MPFEVVVVRMDEVTVFDLLADEVVDVVEVLLMSDGVDLLLGRDFQRLVVLAAVESDIGETLSDAVLLLPDHHYLYLLISKSSI